MLSTVDLEAMNSLNSELNWKNVKKGRRSRRSMARNFNGDAKFGGTGRRHSTSLRSDDVPVKERSCLHQLQSWISSSYCQNSSSMQSHFPSTISLDNEQHICPSFSSGDFSGIELLAAAASMEDDLENAGKDVVSENIIAPRSSDAASFTSQSKGFAKQNESETSSSDMTMHQSHSEFVPHESADASKTQCGSPKDDAMPKVSRRHWDLNTLMDTWVDPFDSNVNDGPLEEREGSEDQLLPNPGGKTDFRTEENKSSDISLDRACSVPLYLVDYAPEPPCSLYSDVTGVCSNQVTAKDNDERNRDEALGCDSHLETSKLLMKADVTLGSSLANKLDSGMFMQSEKINSVSGIIAKLQDEDGLSNTNVCNETIVSARVRTSTQDVNVCGLLAVEASESMNGVLSNDSKDSKMASRVYNATYSVQTTRSFTSERPHDDGENNSDTVELVRMQRDSDPTMDEAKKITPSGAEAQCDHSDVSVAMIDLTVEAQNVDEVFHDKRGHTGGFDISKHPEEYDSLYEDGELRGSSLCSWEDNALENECVDYESNGRNGDAPVVADHSLYEVGEDGSEGSHSTEVRSLLLSRFPEGPSKYESVTHYSRRHHVNNDETCGKGKSNAESGTTFEQPEEIVIEENDEFWKRQQWRDRRDLVEGKSRDMDGCKLKMGDRSSLQPCIERRFDVDAVDRRDSYFVERCRSRHTGGSFLHNERELTPERYQGRYRPTCYSEQDGVDQWAHWGSKKHHASIYLGTEARGRTRQGSITNTLPEKFSRLNNYDQRQTANYMSRGFHRPLMRRRSPVERDDSFGMGRKMPLTRGASSRRYYSGRTGGDFGEDIVPLPENDATTARLSHHSSTRESSLSPSPVRTRRTSIHARRSRSRSRTPPRILNSRRGINLGLSTRKHGRSPEFRYDVRTERGRFTHNKPVFADEYKENCWLLSRGRFSPHQRRWDDDRTFANNSLGNRRSPGRIFRRTQRYDSTGSSGRLLNDEDFQSAARSRRFSFRSSGVREPKLKTSYDNRNCDDISDIMNKGPPVNERRALDKKNVESLRL